MTPRRAKNKSQRGHNIIGPRIRKARVKMKPAVSQNDLAARLSTRGLDMDRPTVTRIENGLRYLRDYEIKLIAKILKVSVAWLFGEAK